jgi:hypothetical protein
MHLQVNLARFLFNTPGIGTLITARFSILLTDDVYPCLPLTKPFLDIEELATGHGVSITRVSWLLHYVLKSWVSISSA